MNNQTKSIKTEYVKCNICNSDDYTVWGHKDGIRITKCKKCELIYSNPRLTREELGKYYSLQYFEEGGYHSDKLRQRMYEIEISKMLPIIGTKGRFLDVGCAMGKFLKSLPDSFEKYGIEFSKEAGEFGIKNFNLKIRIGQLSEIDVEKGFYDVVQMRGVIEHLQDPSKESIYVNKALKMGGWFVLNMTPNIGSLSGIIYKQRFNQVFPREHLYYFSLKTLKSLLEKRGFQIKHVFYPYLGTPYASPLKDFVLFFLNWLIGKESPPFYGNMMAVYSQKVKEIDINKLLNEG